MLVGGAGEESSAEEKGWEKERMGCPWEQTGLEGQEPATAEELAGQRSRQAAVGVEGYYEAPEAELPPPLPRGDPRVEQRIAVVSRCLEGLHELGQGRLPAGWQQLEEDVWLEKLRAAIIELADAEKFEVGCTEGRAFVPGEGRGWAAV